MLNKLTTLINIYPYLLIEDNITEELFNKYKRWVYELEYGDLCFNSGQVQYQIESESMEDIFEVIKYLSYNKIKWNFNECSRICGWMFSNSSDPEIIYRNKRLITRKDYNLSRNYRIYTNVSLNYRSYIKFINIIKDMCYSNDFSIEILSNFPNKYVPTWCTRLSDDSVNIKTF